MYVHLDFGSFDEVLSIMTKSVTRNSEATQQSRKNREQVSCAASRADGPDRTENSYNSSTSLRSGKFCRHDECNSKSTPVRKCPLTYLINSENNFCT